MNAPYGYTVDRATIERIVAEEARRHRTTSERVIMGAKHQRAVAARRIAIRRIVAETGCSIASVARGWGMWGSSAKAAFREATGPYDARTLQQLAWLYGADRAEDIVEGRDEATNADLAAWWRVCAKAGPP